MKNETPRRKFIKDALWTSLLTSWGISTSKGWAPPLISGIKNRSEKIKDHFLLDKGYYYFNTAGLGPTLTEAIEQYEVWTRKHEMHMHHGLDKKEKCRGIAADFFQCKTEEITFTRNTTEGINIVASGISFNEGDEIIISNHEHVGGAVPWMHQSQLQNLQLKVVDLDISGQTNLERICEAISSRTKVVALSHVTCSNGMILPVQEIIEYCREKGILTCIDGAQSAGMIPVNLGEMQPDFFATSGHKWLFGPRESGILYINQNSIDQLTPAYAGAYTTQDYSLPELRYSYREVAPREEYGTRNSAQQIALATSLAFVQNSGIDNVKKHGNNLVSQLREKLSSIKNIQVLSPSDEYGSSILTFKSSHPNFNEKMIQHFYKEYKLRLRWIYEGQLDAIRVSCAFFNDEEDISYLIDCLTKELT